MTIMLVHLMPTRHSLRSPWVARRHRQASLRTVVGLANLADDLLGDLPVQTHLGVRVLSVAALPDFLLRLQTCLARHRLYINLRLRRSHRRVLIRQAHLHSKLLRPRINQAMALVKGASVVPLRHQAGHLHPLHTVRPRRSSILANQPPAHLTVLLLRSIHQPLRNILLLLRNTPPHLRNILLLLLNTLLHLLNTRLRAHNTRRRVLNIRLPVHNIPQQAQRTTRKALVPHPRLTRISLT